MWRGFCFILTNKISLVTTGRLLMVAKIGLNLNMKAIFVVMYTTWAVEKIRPEKNLGLYGISREVMNYFTGFFGTNIVINSLVELFTSIAKVIGSIRVQA